MPMPSALRLFIAVDPPAATAGHADRLVERLRRSGADTAWANPAHLHLTLHFLGNAFCDNDLPGLCAAIDEACRAMPPFDLEVRGVGAFPSPANPRTIWLGVGRGAEALIRLHESLATCLQPLGYRPEARGYMPHITIGRLRRETPRAATATRALSLELASLVDLPVGVGKVTGVTLFSSRLGPTGPVHERLHTSHLHDERKANGG